MKMEAACSECILWIDQVNKVISFVKTEGFEPKRFSTYEERLNYALAQGTSGYRIQ